MIADFTKWHNHIRKAAIIQTAKPENCT